MENDDKIGPVINRAFELAHSFEHEYVTLEHILTVLLENDDVIELLEKMQTDHKTIADNLMVWLQAADDMRVPGLAKPRKTATLERVFNRAFMQALFSGRQTIAPVDIVTSILSEKNSQANYLLVQAGLNKEKILKTLAEMNVGTRSDESDSRKQNDKALKKYCVDLNAHSRAGKIDPLIGRETEVANMVDIMARRKKNNIILVGEPGVGKTALVEGMARMITTGAVPNTLKNKTIYSLDLAALLAGTKFRGEFEERIKSIINALEQRDDAILFIDEIHQIMGAGAGSTGAMDAANMFKPSLARGSIHCIGSTTYEEFRKHFEKDRALIRRFTKVDVEEMTAEATKNMLRQLMPSYIDYHNVGVDEDAMDLAVDLSRQHILDRYLPDKAIDILDSAMARLRVRGIENSVVDTAAVREEISRQARVPASQITEDQKIGVLELESRIKNNVFGQETAVDRLLDAVYIARAGLKDPERPMGCYLFVGPTGTGKTEVAVQLSLGLGIPLLRYDMSEYMEAHKVATLIGSPPGYIGYADGGAGSGKLINDIEKNPNCVILFDEVEKAHPDVLNVLLSLMDTGLISSSNGKTVNARNATLILTSNLGAAASERQTIGFSGGYNDSAVGDAVSKHFPPEFRNRLDAVVEFNRLKPEVLGHIVDKFMRQLNRQLDTEDRVMKLRLTDAARAALLKEGYSETMGARPMKRVINERIKKPLSRHILFDSWSSGVVNIDSDGKEFQLSYEQAE